MLNAKLRDIVQGDIRGADDERGTEQEDGEVCSEDAKSVAVTFEDTEAMKNEGVPNQVFQNLGRTPAKRHVQLSSPGR